MLNSVWLDIAIGVVLVWFLFALAVSAINEGIAKVLALRSKNLWTALRQMLDGTESPKGLLRSVAGLPLKSRPSSPFPAANASVSARLYATHTVQALELRSKPSQKTRIEHLPASVFSHALIELAMKAEGGLVTAVDDAGGIDAAAAQVEGAAAQVKGAADQVRSYIDNLPPGPLRSQLQSVLAGSTNDLVQFRDGVERWFDGQMTRLSRIYRAQVHVILILIGLVVAVASFGFGLQSDSLQLVSQLQNDQNVRAAVVGAASDAVRGDLIKEGCPTTDTSSTNTTSTTSTPAACQLKGLAKLDKLNFALSKPVPSNASFWERIGYLTPWRHFYTLLGVLITGIAISFGSSFWFALLKRLVGLRSGGGTAPS
jgi:hypothetical protein